MNSSSLFPPCTVVGMDFPEKIHIRYSGYGAGPPEGTDRGACHSPVLLQKIARPGILYGTTGFFNRKIQSALKKYHFGEAGSDY